MLFVFITWSCAGPLVFFCCVIASPAVLALTLHSLPLCRLLVALPLIFLQCVVPFTFNPVKESVSFGIATFLTVWLNNCKVGGM